MRAQPYPTSWINRLLDWLDRLPGPVWIPYLLAWALLFALETAMSWQLGVLDRGELSVFLATFSATPMIALALIRLTDQWASVALERTLPALTAPTTQIEIWRYRLTTTPRRDTLIATVAGIAFAVFSAATFAPQVARAAQLAWEGPSAWINTIIYILIWCCLGPFIYHAVHQLREVRAIYDSELRIDLFNQNVLYAFSQLTALSAVGFALLFSGRFLTPRELQYSLPGLLIAALTVIIVAASFIWPLLGLHRQIVAEKNRALAESSARLNACLAELRTLVDDRDYERVDAAGKALAVLEAERNLLKSAPTWPWQPGALRAAIAALFLPLVIWLIQLFLERFLAR